MSNKEENIEEVEVLEESSNSETPKFDPVKKYQWKPEDTFSLNGQEFAFTYNYLMSKKTELLTELEVLNILEQKLIKAVESGTAVEVAEEEK